MGVEIATEGGGGASNLSQERGFVALSPSSAEAKEIQTMVLRSLEELMRLQ